MLNYLTSYSGTSSSSCCLAVCHWSSYFMLASSHLTLMAIITMNCLISSVHDKDSAIPFYTMVWLGPLAIRVYKLSPQIEQVLRQDLRVICSCHLYSTVWGYVLTFRGVSYFTDWLLLYMLLSLTPGSFQLFIVWENGESLVCKLTCLMLR